jgi:tight adherence protein B
VGSLIGLVFGIGVALVALAWIEPRTARRRAWSGNARLRSLLASAGVSSLRPGGLIVACVGAAAVSSLVAFGITRLPAVAVVSAVLGGWAPIALLRGRAARRIREHAEVWPDAVDNLASAIRAGLSLPESLIQLGVRGPEQLRAAFVHFGRDYRASGRFDESLDLLKTRLSDPVADRVIEGLRIARDVGGGDVGRMLRSLAGFLRDELRTRGELESRQSWTVNGARIAVAAPWLVLLAMSVQPGALDAFASVDGAIVLGGGAVVCVVAYRVMERIGRLPVDRRVLA